MAEERLVCLAELVRPGSRVADIGTDHAYLPVMLVGSGKCPLAIATDIHDGPVCAARHTVEAAGLTAAIRVRRGDGLQPVNPDEADDIVIAGMGGETIAAILAAADWICRDTYRLILQPMSRPEDLRRWLLTHGFTIETERSLAEGRHLYTILRAYYTAAPVVSDPLAWYIGGLSPERDRPYLERLKQRLRIKADGVAHKPGGETEAVFWRELAARILPEEEVTP